MNCKPFSTLCARIHDKQRGWDKSPSLSIVFGLLSKTQWLSRLYYADFISFYSPTQLCGGGTTKSNSNELQISVPLSYLFFVDLEIDFFLLSDLVASLTSKIAPLGLLSRTVMVPLKASTICLAKDRPKPKPPF